jgi:NTE family protein
VQLIYRPIEPQGALKDFAFNRSTMETRWQRGLSDARNTLQASPWLAPMPRELGVRVFDITHDPIAEHRDLTVDDTESPAAALDPVTAS